MTDKLVSTVQKTVSNHYFFFTATLAASSIYGAANKFVLGMVGYFIGVGLVAVLTRTR